ncbi:hypothetical protein [Halalkalicoccus tibetensis]|uniref:Uncharacterized protein n=1 Tax=Halalkalicoccus tibetensis TaxID=175632 RepID=A0ABD5V5G6_9EURY
MPRSRPAVAARLLALVLLLGSAAALGAAATADPSETTIVEVYPNTNHAGNAGEYLVVEFPDDGDLAEYSLTDGKTTTPLGDDTVSGAVAFSRAPDLTRGKVAHPVYELPEHFAMA